jgi:hypothetical protein
MLTLRLTKKLAASLRIPLVLAPHPPANPCADWCCTRFIASRHSYLLLTNTTTYFSTVLPAQGLTNEAAFNRGTISGLRRYLTLAGHEFTFDRYIGPEIFQVLFRSVNDRRILGVMNEFVFMAKYYLLDLSPAETSDRLNDCPVGPLGGKFPRDVFPSAGQATK